MDRREFLQNTAAAGAAGALGSSPLLAGAPDRPNVLLIVVDEMRRPCWFPDQARLPNYDGLKKQGLEFTSHFTSASPCSPSRATILTGLHQPQHGLDINTDNAGQPSLSPRIPTIGHLFRKAGYRTPYAGKWHLTKEPDHEDEGLGPYGFNWIQPELPDKPHPWPGVVNDKVYAEAAANWLQKSKAKSKPWFLTVSLVNPHDICGFPSQVEWKDEIKVPPYTRDLPGNWDDDLSKKPSCQAAQIKGLNRKMGEMDPNDKKVWRRYLDYYYYFNKQMDTQLGRVLKALSDSGQQDNTVVVFTSDHGDMAGSHHLRYKGANIYNEHLNVPLIVSWPGQVPQDEKTKAITQSVDLFPTLAAMAGVNARALLPYLPGRDLSDVLADPGQPGSSHALFSISLASQKKVPQKRDNEDGETNDAPPRQRNSVRSIRERRWAYARYFNPRLEGEEYELYDLKNDPHQMQNLAADPAARAQLDQMAQKLKVAEATEMAPIDPSKFHF